MDGEKVTILQGSPSAHEWSSVPSDKGGSATREVSPTQVRTCPKTETSLKGLSNFTKLLPHLPRACLPFSLPALLHPSQTHVSSQGTRASAFVKHSILSSQAADEELNVTGSNPGWPAAYWAGEGGCLPLAGPHEAMWQWSPAPAASAPREAGTIASWVCGSRR